MKITIAGGTGFLGTALSKALVAGGHDVTILSRSGASRQGLRTITWIPDGTAGGWAAAAIDGAEVVVNLAGDSIAGGRWTAARKTSIRESRVLATRSLVAALRASRMPPRVFVSSSAQGYYGDRGDQRLTEQDGPGDDFLARVSAAWEAEARTAPAGIRLVLLRTGVVLDRRDGALPRIVAPFRLFGGGPVGSGRQFMAWIHVADWVGMVSWAAELEAVDGPLNVSAPEPARNRDFSAAIARAINRPSWLPVPRFVLKAALGEMADSLLLTSTRMIPDRALALGYRFRFPDLDAALADVLAAKETAG